MQRAGAVAEGLAPRGSGDTAWPQSVCPGSGAGVRLRGREAGGCCWSPGNGGD